MIIKFLIDCNEVGIEGAKVFAEALILNKTLE